MNGQPKHPVETPRAWLRYAESDLGVARREIVSETPAYPTICFLCQSATEKFLKGFLIAQGWSLEKTYDLVKLLALCADYDAELGAMVAEGAALNEYIVAERYPGDITFEEIGQAQAKEALDAAQRIGNRVTALIGTD
jgi:HEPN domain-containing protein